MKLKNIGWIDFEIVFSLESVKSDNKMVKKLKILKKFKKKICLQKSIHFIE